MCVALQHDAPAALVRRLVELADTLRSHVGGAAEAEPGGLPPAALAAQAGQLEALDEVGRSFLRLFQGCGWIRQPGSWKHWMRWVGAFCGFFKDVGG